MTDEQIRQLEKAMLIYQKYCAVRLHTTFLVALLVTTHSMKEVQEEYGKSFDFLKQHASQHVPQDIREKGTVDNFSTRNGEGVQQEASQAFKQTNMKNAEHQVSALIVSGSVCLFQL
jgi:hypothetical protein